MRLCQGLSLCRNRLGIDKANLATWRLSLHPYLRQVTLFSRSQFSSSSLTQSQPEFGIKRPRKAPPLSTYEYRPLPGPKSTRIAILEPAEGFNEPVRLTLKRVSLQNLGRVRYEALSYVWGPVSGDRRVYCDGKIIHITPNCESALRHLRLKKKKRTLWIDALCINQNSNTERSRQVPLMGDIYESASRVLIWLGPGSDEIASVFHRATFLSPFISSPLFFLRSFGPRVGDQVRKWNLVYSVSNWLWHRFYHRSLADAEGIIHISCNEWFSRMWTIQEHLLAKQSVLVAGYHYCSWTAFSSYWMWSLRAIHSLRKGSLPASLRIATWVAFKNTAAAKRGQSISSASFDIFSGFVECARTHRARDPRDKVYAFLPLIQKLQPSVAPLPVNYSLSYSRVYQDFARYTIRLSGTLKYLESLPPLRHKSSLPSWVMDLQTPAKFAMKRWAASQLDARATGDSKVDLQLLEYSRSHELLLRGSKVSHIKVLSTPAPMKPEHADELKDWFFGWIGDIGTAVRQGNLPWAYNSVESGLDEFLDGVIRFDPFLGGSVLFLTSSGHVGVSNFHLQHGDQIVLLAGCSLPTVLRSSGSQGKMHFLGVSFVAGISHGEAWDHLSTNDTATTRLETFTLI
ncbi:heterokaryon incompatibility protein-domain-containing protein [Ilyonectria robusta]|uniref:heterokaryon incompatibility protein-domain-containing protein n=1 Tax=Ilyonectria robusta TaxID=1079257 RepID=UPI001E8D9D33|nr:heterokaryon incompatibility protein-domain-containing protein [Ilyonectria robusta]KAH8679447.1 heterokaryon incompatibility protein-domain-containing protein [Ilyonectria robusta]